MNKKVVFIKDNSPEIRKKLKEAGFSICDCATFDDAIWLSYYPEGRHPFDFHGEGYCDTDMFPELEKLSPLMRIKAWLKGKNYYCQQREYYGNVEEFLKHYNPPKK